MLCYIFKLINIITTISSVKYTISSDLLATLSTNSLIIFNPFTLYYINDDLKHKIESSN